MRVLLISANTEKINMMTIPIGLGAVAAATEKAGHDVEMLDLLNKAEPVKEVAQTIKGFQPEIIGLSVRNIDDQSKRNTQFLLEKVKEVISACRDNSKALIVLGGAGYSLFPESALSCLGADMGVQGEGEEAFCALLSRIERGSGLAGSPGLYLPGKGVQGKRRFNKDLDSFPIPPAKLWSDYTGEKGDLWIPFQTRRGCPMDCSYCATAVIEGRYIRKRRPENVVAALARYVEAGFLQFFFTDNTFNFPPSYAKALCRLINERQLDISWRCIVYPKNVDSELVSLMAKAGCKEISLGCESGCNSILQQFNKKFDKEEIERVSRLFKDNGIDQMGFLLLGGPGETKETVEESLAFIESLDLTAVRLTAGIRIYPGTKMVKAAIKDGFISNEAELLEPKFYLVRDLAHWLENTVDRLVSRHPHWIT